MKTPRSQVLRARKAALRAEIARRRRSMAASRRPRRSRKKWLLLLLLLLLLLFLRPCPPEVPAPAPEPPPAALPVGGSLAPTPTAPEPHSARIVRQVRPAFDGPTPEPLPWLDAFRLQVAARGPRLADCFAGAPRPGALKWTAAVEPVHGRVSDQTLEPTLASDALTSAQRACALAVLSEPAYRMDAAEGASTPSRVGMVIEF